ncbi:hypothetical protein Tco_1285220 [Tanacetum coccineum]
MSSRKHHSCGIHVPIGMIPIHIPNTIKNSVAMITRFKYINEVIKGVTFRHERHATDVATTSSSGSNKRNNMDHRIGVNGLQLCMFLVPNTGKQEKERRTCRDYLKYEESRVKIKSESISKKKKSNYSSFQDLRSSCNEDMVKYEGPWPSTTRARTLNEKSNKKIPPATSQPLGWRVCRPTE